MTQEKKGKKDMRKDSINFKGTGSPDGHGYLMPYMIDLGLNIAIVVAF